MHLDDFTQTHYTVLLRIALTLLRGETRTEHSAQTLVHEAYLCLTHQRHTPLNSIAHGFRLYRQVMRRLLIDASRRQQAVRHGGTYQRVPWEAAVHQPAADQGGMATVQDALARLPTHYATLLRLRLWEGYTQHEAAEQLSVSVSTVKRWWRAARPACATLLTT
ncbi:MAG: sigma-70 family RNA polymerase sigma factor [Bacteroidota bacterium]